MSMTVQAFVALAPILLAAVLLVAFRVAAKVAMPVVYVAAVVLAWSVWRVDLRHIAASTVQGLFIAISAYSSDPSSGMVAGGLIVTVVGVVGFLVARIAARRRSS